MPLNHSFFLKNLRLHAFIRDSKVLLSCIFCLFVGSSAFAGLKWKTTSQDVSVNPLQAAKTVKFDFTNSGDKSVTILRLNPSCGCISGKVEKKTYAPGETGEVLVTLNLQGRQGALHKGIAVVTDVHPANPTMLYFNTTIPKTYVSSVKRLVWALGEKHGPKSCRLSNAGKQAFRLEKAVPVRDGVKVQLTSVRDGYIYKLVVTPSAKLKNTFIPIIIYPQKPKGVEKVRTFTVYALVK